MASDGGGGGDGGGYDEDAAAAADDDGKSARSHSTTSTAAQLRANSATITGTRAAMWAGLGFGNLFVTYAAKGTFVVGAIPVAFSRPPIACKQRLVSFTFNPCT